MYTSIAYKSSNKNFEQDLQLLVDPQVSCLRLPSSLIFILLTSSKAEDISFVLLLILKEAKEVHINLARVVDPASKHQH